MVNSIGGVAPPPDFSVYWRLLVFNDTSGSWESSPVGADALVLMEGDAVAWHFSAWDGAFPAAVPDHRYPVADFRGGPYHRGSSGAGAITYPEPAWSVDLGTGPIDATPLAVGGHVYIFANGETDWATMQVTSEPTVFCLDMETGGSLWSTIVGGSSWQASTPVYYNGVLYAGSTDGALYALDTSDGHILWNYTTTDSFNGITSSPVVAPDGISPATKALYFGSGSGHV
jgi:outer membrane protein assembly factor BamB